MEIDKFTIIVWVFFMVPLLLKEQADKKIINMVPWIFDEHK